MSWINSHTSFTTFSATKELKRLVKNEGIRRAPTSQVFNSAGIHVRIQTLNPRIFTGQDTIHSVRAMPQKHQSYGYM